MATKEQMRNDLMADLERLGVDEFKDAVYPTFRKAIIGTQRRLETGIGIIAVGYENIDPVALEIGIECLVEKMPEGKEKEQVKADLAYWQEHREEITNDHHMTPAES